MFNMQLPTRILLLNLCFGASWSAFGQAPNAPEPASNEAVALDAVRVTADLWASPLDRIAASVNVYGDETLRIGAVRHFGDLVDQIPNLTWTGGTSRPRYLQIRGIGENSQYEGETPDSAVRFLVDDLDFTGLGSLGSTFDVSQVEVLRGPQAGAFGANAAGGVVRLVTQAPTPYWTGFMEGSIGEDDLRSAGFAVGGPLLSRRPDELMMRLSVQQHTSDGFRRNVFLHRDTNERDELTARLRLDWNPSADWQWQSTLLFSSLDNGFDSFALDNNGEYTYSDQPGRDEQESVAGSLRGTYRGWGAARLTTVTSAAWLDSVYSYDDDWTAASYEGFSDVRRDRTVFNQELRLDSDPDSEALGWIDRWTVGAFWSETDETTHYTNEDPGNVRGLRTRYRGRNKALFGQVAHDFTPRTRLIAGLRAEAVEVEGWGLKTRYRKGPGTYDPEVRIAPDFDDTMFGGKVTLEHDWTERTLVFVSLARGYKAGGINVDARIDPAVDPLSYGTEYLWNFEAGVRGHSADQRLRAELVAFHLRRHDTQIRDSAGFGGSYRFFTDNAESADITGAEASGSYWLTDRLTVHGSLALMDSQLDPFELSSGGTAGGRRLANTPRYGYTVGLRYQEPRGWFGSLELVGRDEFYDSNNHDEARSAFNVLNASLGYGWRDWEFTLWARNLFDEKYEKRVFFFGNEDPDYPTKRYEDVADPRQVGFTARYRF